jgi:uncharacterized protein YkwD
MVRPLHSLVPRLGVRLTGSLGSSSRRTALAVALLLGISSVFTFAAPSGTLAWDSGSFSSSSEAELVTLTNRARANAGLRALKVDSTLTSVARWRSKDMIDRNYFSHDIPGYGKVWDKLAAIGYCYKVGGENIGWNNYPDDIATAAIQQMFMASAGHRANILGTGWNVIGIGAYKGPTGKKMWTVLFADKCGSTPAPTPRPTARPTPRPTARPTARPTPRPTPRPTARPTARPVTVTKTSTPQPTPAPTPSDTSGPSPDSTPPIATDGLNGPSLQPAPTPTDTGTTGATSAPTDGTVNNAAVGMRVLDLGATDGLLETIVGGVAGIFFGG